MGLYADLKYEDTHTMASGERIKIKDMSIGHLKNALGYADRYINTDYWDLASIKFKEELESRKSKKKKLLVKDLLLNEI